MAIIHKLDDDVLCKLKSQSLLISPTSAIRELVQNSIDAGADVIRLTLKLDCLKLMVLDNGCGISPQNLNTLGNQNVTSKISSLADLQTLKTYGYKGEAISSIANLANLTIVSKTKDLNSTWIRRLPTEAYPMSEVDKKTSQEDVHFKLHDINEEGTVVLIENLLHNLPVRRKTFEKLPCYRKYMSIKNDLFQILIQHPNTAISADLVNEKGNIWNLFRSDNIKTGHTLHEKMSIVFSNVYGALVSSGNFKKVTINFKQYRIDGIISLTGLATRAFQFIFVNGRKYEDSSLIKSLDNMFLAAGYSDWTKPGVHKIERMHELHPVLIFYIKCPNEIDNKLKNPEKNSFRLPCLPIIHPLICKMIESFLRCEQSLRLSQKENNGSADILIATEGESPETSMVNMRASTKRMPTRGKQEALECKGNSLASNMESHRSTWKQRRISKVKKKKLFSNYTIEVKNLRDSFLQRGNDDLCKYYPYTEKAIGISISRSQLKNVEVIKQVDKKFILLRLVPSKSNKELILFMIDQHAADERIKLEILLRTFLIEISSGTIRTKSLVNCRIHLMGAEIELFNHFESEFKRWAIIFSIETYKQGISVLNIVSLPDILHQKLNGNETYIKRVLLQIANDLNQYNKLPMPEFQLEGILQNQKCLDQWWKYITHIPSIFREILNSKACRSAVMFGDELSKDECDLLIKNLADCEAPFQCAHGRPSIIPLTEIKSLKEKHCRNADEMALSGIDYDISN